MDDKNTEKSLKIVLDPEGAAHNKFIKFLIRLYLKCTGHKDS